jgi:hypothetical protein
MDTALYLWDIHWLWGIDLALLSLPNVLSVLGM